MRLQPAYPYRLLLAVLLTMGVGCERWGSEEAARERPYVHRASEDPEGTGKFYMGREIPRVVGHGEADWMERPSRAVQELPSRVVQALELGPSDVVADIGAGTGYFTFRISPLVPYGKVYAVDIDPEMLSLIRARMEEENVQNVVPVEGTASDPRLPAGAIDLALIVDSYHEFSHPREMMTKVVEALEPGGRLVLVEYRGEDPTLPVQPIHRMTQEQARVEMAAVGLRWVETLDILPQQHLMIFTKPVGAE